MKGKASLIKLELKDGELVVDVDTPDARTALALASVLIKVISDKVGVTPAKVLKILGLAIETQEKGGITDA